MGTDNLHHRRKQRKLDSFRRNYGNKEPYEVVLIVCEGEKTERFYLESLREDLKLRKANVKIIGRGADPKTIVDDAIKEFEKSRDAPYDKVYCIFDQDQHQSFQSALNEVNRHQRKIPMHAIVSIPCFEYWILLHFEDTTRPYLRKGKKSPGDQLVSELMRHIRDYKKGDKKIYEKTKHLLDTAISRAEKIEKEQSKNFSDNPSTKIHNLVKYLQQLKLT